MNDPTKTTTRREVLSALGAAGLLLLACDDGGGGGAMDARADGRTSDAAIQPDGAIADASVDPDAAGDPDAAANPDMPPVADAWATGGTAAMNAKDQYPDPFTAGLGAVCAVVASTTEGPCTTATDLDREDISEAWAGLPVRLALKIVDARCAPIAGAVVRVWHTNLEGSYSGQTPNNRMCLQNQDYSSSDFFRGVQTSDAEGQVFFDTCFPGWYRGRAVHIHFQVVADGQSTRISQLTFPDATITEIFASHPDYAEYGQPDTAVATDNIFSRVSADEQAALVLDVARMPDGAMLASKVVAVM